MGWFYGKRLCCFNHLSTKPNNTATSPECLYFYVTHGKVSNIPSALFKGLVQRPSAQHFPGCLSQMRGSGSWSAAGGLQPTCECSRGSVHRSPASSCPRSLGEFPSTDKLPYLVLQTQRGKSPKPTATRPALAELTPNL